MTSEHVSAILRDGMELADVARRDPGAPVGAYRGWSMLDLVAHTGSVHRRVLEIVGSASAGAIERRAYLERDEIRLFGWFIEGLESLVDVLRRSDPADPVWTFADDQTVGFWHRRMAHETAIHRWDAEHASGDPRPIDAWLAMEAIPESLDLHVLRPLASIDPVAGDELLELRSTEPPGVWRLRFGSDAIELDDDVDAGMEVDEDADVTVLGVASDAWLYLMSRPNDCRVDGRRDVAQRFERMLDTIPRPGF